MNGNCLRSNENLDNHIGKSVERNFSRSFQRSARGESGMQFRWPKEFLINNDLGYDVFQISK